MKKPTISAIIPTYNRKAHVVRAINSILSQDSLPTEIIVVDDGSTDGTSTLLEKEFGEKIRIFRQPNSGVSKARRAGLDLASGDWIAFLDSDDEWTPGRSQKMQCAAENIPRDVSWIFGDTRVVEDDSASKTLFQMHNLIISRDVTIFEDSLSVQCPFQFGLLQSSLVRRQDLLDANAFCEKLSSSEDFLVGFNLALTSKVAAIPNVVTKLYRTSDLTSSSLDYAGHGGEDYYRARTMAFSAAVIAKRAGPWRKLYEDAVRGQYLARSTDSIDASLVLKQFRFGLSGKSAAFTVAAFAGPGGLWGWRKLSQFVHGGMGRRPKAH